MASVGFRLSRMLWLLALCIACCAVARADEAALTRHATELRADPRADARSIAALPAQAAVTRGDQRQGPWVQVRTADGATGWLHLFDLAPAAAPAVDAATAVGDALRGVTRLLGGVRPAQAYTTAGIRGLDAADLARAQPSLYGLAEVGRQRQGEAEARAFAQAAALHAVAVPSLPAPARPPPAPSIHNPAREPQSP